MYCIYIYICNIFKSFSSHCRHPTGHFSNWNCWKAIFQKLVATPPTTTHAMMCEYCVGTYTLAIIIMIMTCVHYVSRASTTDIPFILIHIRIFIARRLYISYVCRFLIHIIWRYKVIETLFKNQQTIATGFPGGRVCNIHRCILS